MDFTCDERLSDSPLVARIWRNQSDEASVFTSMAETHWGMVVTKHQGQITLTIRGPETHASPAYCPPDTEFFGIQFKAGAFMPQLPIKTVMDRSDLNLPQAGSQSVWLQGAAWELPNFENAESFVQRLIHDELLVYEPVVEAALAGHLSDMSLRSVQRRFLRATGLTYSTRLQIERARAATALLKQGVSILDTVDAAGYADQPHLTRSLRRFIGQTPAQIISENRVEPLSFLFKTLPV